MNLGALKCQEIKNYKELCSILDIPVYGGYQKTKQLKELARYFHYEKQGHKFIILEIYDKPKPDTRVINSKYIEHIQNTLVCAILDKQVGEATFTKQELYELLGLTNRSYNIYKTCNKQLKEEIGISTQLIDEFYGITTMKFRDMMYSAFNSLQKRNILNYETVYKIQILEKDIYREASEEEHTYIVNTIKRFMTNTSHLTYREIKTVYRKLRAMFLKSRGWDYVIKSYKFYLNADMNYSDFYSESKELNAVVVATFHTYFKKICDTDEEKLNAFNTLIDLLIKI